MVWGQPRNWSRESNNPGNKNHKPILRYWESPIRKLPPQKGTYSTWPSTKKPSQNNHSKRNEDPPTRQYSEKRRLQHRTLGRKNHRQQHQQRPQRERDYGKTARGKPTQSDHIPNTSTQTGTKSIIITVPTEAIRCQVGKQGKTVKKLENERIIKIRISQRVENDPNQTVTITGPKTEKVTRSTEETREMIDKFEKKNHYQKKPEKTQQPCFFYRQRTVETEISAHTSTTGTFGMTAYVLWNVTSDWDMFRVIYGL